MLDYNVVLVDDDLDLLDVISLGLRDEFSVRSFSRPQEAVQYLSSNKFDAVVMDFHMPGHNSFQVLTEIRNQKYQQPVLFLTGDANPALKIESLDQGVDDFILKPVSTMELSAHLRNRIKAFRHKHPTVTHVKNLEINKDFPEVKLNGENIALTRKEFEILSILTGNLNSVVQKEEIIRRVWSNVTVEDNNLDTHLSNLRKKLKGFDGHIKTLKGFGYVMRE